MIKTVSNSLFPVLKWGTVIISTAIVVISVQVFADGQSPNSVKETLDPNIVTADLVPSKELQNKAATQGWSPMNGFADLIAAVSPAVVHVAISGTVKPRRQMPDFNFPPGSPFEDFFERYKTPQQPDQKQRSRPLGIGSGFIISADGYVVTNNHVIKDADEIVITLTDGTEFTAVLKGADSKTDLALLKIDNVTDLPYVTWGDDSASRVGDWVLAIGNPFGLGGSASTGIISARGRDIRSGPYDDYIQVDAAINRGNSGGPLFNLKGEVIGINTAIYSPNGGSVGIGFSIPSNLAENVISQLQDSGEVERAWIGVEIQQLTKELADGFERENDHGALISSVVPGKPADKGGMQAGDIILSFDGQEIEEMRDLPRIVAQSGVGKQYKVVVWRNGSKKTLSIKTDRFPDNPRLAGAGSSAPETDETAQDDVIGAELSELNSELRARHSLDSAIQGVLVLDVARDGLAARNGLRAGDVITAVDNKRVSKPSEITTLVQRAKKNSRESMVMLLQGGNGSRFIPFDISE